MIGERENGKLFVELLDLDSGISLNMQLVKNGLAHQDLSIQDERDETASSVSLPISNNLGEYLFLAGHLIIIISEAKFDLYRLHS